MKLINLTGAKNFIDADGTKYVDVNQKGEKEDYNVSNTIARRLLPLVNSLDVPYFSLSTSILDEDDDEDLEEDSEVDTQTDDEDDSEDEDATGADESDEDESEDESDDDEVEAPKTIQKKVIKVGGKSKKDETKVQV